MNQPPCQSKPHPPLAAHFAARRGFLGLSPGSGAPAAVGLCSLWPSRHTARRLHAPSWCLALLACLAFPATQALAQPAPTPAPTPAHTPAAAPQPAPAASPQPEQAATPPEAAGSLAAFSVVRAWVNAMQAPEQPEALLTVPVASVTLRYLGEPVGRGVDTTGDATTVWRAAREAIADAARKLPLPKDAALQARLRELATQMTLTVELGGALVPLREATYDEIDDAVSPGIDGLAARSGKELRVVLPSTMLASGTLPGQACATLLGEVLGDPARALRVDPEAQPAKIAARDGARLYRFGVAHLGQPAPGDPGTFLLRGGYAISLSDVTAANLKAMGDGLAKHLLLRLAPPGEKGAPFTGLRGAYFPVRGLHVPEIAPASEQALITAAIASWAGRERADADLRDPVAALLAGFFAKETRVDPTKDARSAMLALWAMDRAAASGIPCPDATSAAICLNAARTADDVGLAGFLALALSTVGAEQPQAVRIADALYAPNEKGLTPDLAGHSPWIMLAERTLGGGSARPQAVAALRAFREKSYSYVLTPADAGEQGADLVGGVVFPGSRPPLPTAQSLRVIAGLAVLLADPRVTPDDVFQRELVRFMPCLRFVRQLCADEWSEPMFREPRRARWGVRSAVWDPRMPGEASALALITVRETLRALDRPTR